ncbi:MAG: hypothetical protein U0163_05215 [Gemmatimonadaceae bacterium]
MRARLVVAELGGLCQPPGWFFLARREVGGCLGDFVRQPLGAIGHGLLALAQGQHVSRAQHDFWDVERLAKEVVGPDVECLVARLAVAGHRDDHDRDVGKVAVSRRSCATSSNPLRLGIS